MTKREIITIILLSIFTCGIYSLYWFYVSTEELNRKESNNPLTGFILAIVLGVLTCGLYLLYWYYKFYKKVDSVTGESNCLINFLLSLFGLSIVSMAIAQNSFNKVK